MVIFFFFFLFGLVSFSQKILKFIHVVVCIHTSLLFIAGEYFFVWMPQSYIIAY